MKIREKDNFKRKFVLTEPNDIAKQTMNNAKEENVFLESNTTQRSATVLTVLEADMDENDTDTESDTDNVFADSIVKNTIIDKSETVVIENETLDSDVDQSDYLTIEINKENTDEESKSPLRKYISNGPETFIKTETIVKTETFVNTEKLSNDDKSIHFLSNSKSDHESRYVLQWMIFSSSKISECIVRFKPDITDHDWLYITALVQEDNNDPQAYVGKVVLEHLLSGQKYLVQISLKEDINEYKEFWFRTEKQEYAVNVEVETDNVEDNFEENVDENQFLFEEIGSGSDALIEEMSGSGFDAINEISGSGSTDQTSTLKPKSPKGKIVLHKNIDISSDSTNLPSSMLLTLLIFISLV